MPLDLTLIRAQFPALKRPAIFFDNPGGTQIAQPVLDRMNTYLVEHNANHDGAFQTSRESDAILDEAHLALADFFNAAQPEEIVFGNNMTSLTFTLSRAIARTWQPGDEIVVTRLDHDANITPWVMAAEDRGCTYGGWTSIPKTAPWTWNPSKKPWKADLDWWPLVTPPMHWARSTRLPN
jgi:selenocysteine lyase/cysteine desulfurase